MNLFAESKNVLDKDGKVNALGPYGKQKLTGREMSTYFRRNKVKDATIKKAVEVALDLGGADTIARKEIKKFYGDKVLKSKEVQQALQYANEAVSPAQQAAIAISKKEKGKEPVNEIFGISQDPRYRAKVMKMLDDEGIKYKKDGRNALIILGVAPKDQKKLLDRIHKEFGMSSYNMIDETLEEKVSYVEYKFKNRKDAEKAMNMFKSTNLISLDINDDNLNGGELAVDAGKKDMSKLHKQVMSKFRPKIQMQESDMQDVDNAPKNKWKALGFSQHPHKGFEDERLPKDMRDFRKKAKTPSQMRVEDAYRAMWEDGEKYAPSIDENIERGIMKKMRRGRVAKGMPR